MFLDQSILPDNPLLDIAKEPSLLRTYIEGLLPSVLSFCIEVILGLVILLIGSRLIKWISKIVRKSLEKSKLEVGVVSFVSSLVKYALYFLLIMLILSQFGVTASSVIAVLGSAGIAVGLALQGSLSNFAGGVLILLLKPFVVGDYIVAGGLEGTVYDITIFYTKLTTVDNKDISIPNGTLSNGSIVNVTKHDKRRVDVNISVAYDTDLANAKEVLRNVGTSYTNTLQDHAIDVFVAELGDSAITLELRVWTKAENYWTTLWDLREQAKVAFDEANIHIPFPQLDVKIKNS